MVRDEIFQDRPRYEGKYPIYEFTYEWKKHLLV